MAIDDHVSEMLKGFHVLGQRIGKSREMLLMEYVSKFEELEKKYESCYGMLHDVRSHTNTCMVCIGERAYRSVLDSYKNTTFKED